MENQTGRLIPNQSFNTYLTRFQSGGYQIDAYQLFSLYLQLGFRSESEQPNWNRVYVKITYRQIIEGESVYPYLQP